MVTNRPNRKITLRHGSIFEYVAYRSSEDEAGCINWGRARNKSGYGIMKWRIYRGLVHRLLYQAAFGKIEAHLCVLHRCDNRKCVNLEHLFVGTNADNVADRVKKGRSASMRGEKSKSAVLTEKEVIEIRGSKLSRAELAKKFRIGRTSIDNVLTRATWKHI